MAGECTAHHLCHVQHLRLRQPGGRDGGVLPAAIGPGLGEIHVRQGPGEGLHAMPCNVPGLRVGTVRQGARAIGRRVLLAIEQAVILHTNSSF
jgi:hypothetical protein